MHGMLLSRSQTYKTPDMKTGRYIWIVAIVFFVASCSNNDVTTTDGKIKIVFKEWAKDNLTSKYRIQSISYDTVGCPMDFIFSATMLGQTIGSSGHADSEINIGGGLIMLDCYLDSTLLTRNIHIAKINVKVHDTIQTFYIGMRGDSICTSPQERGYEALSKTHSNGEQRLYDACFEIYTNLDKIAKSNGGAGRNIGKEDFYDFWIALPSYEETMSQTRYSSVLNSRY